MDFSDVETWVAFAPHGQPGVPAGSVAWRFRQAAEDPGGLPCPRVVLEVLFLAVPWHARRERVGEMLADALKQEAIRRQAVMYVEVGAHETDAQGFWRSNGFVPIGESAGDLCTDLQRRFYEGACWRFSDTVQFVFDPCHVPPPQAVPVDCQYRMMGSSSTRPGGAGGTACHVLHGQWLWPDGSQAGSFEYVCRHARAGGDPVEAMERGASFIGEYEGGFEMPSPDGELQAVREAGLVVEFVSNSEQGWNVRGAGRNAFGAFKLVGFMSAGDANTAQVEVGKSYLRRPDGWELDPWTGELPSQTGLGN